MNQQMQSTRNVYASLKQSKSTRKGLTPNHTGVDVLTRTDLTGRMRAAKQRPEDSAYRQRKGMSDSEVRDVPGPKRLEMNRLTDFPASIHLRGLTIKLWQL